MIDAALEIEARPATTGYRTNQHIAPVREHSTQRHPKRGVANRTEASALLLGSAFVF
jgi:hypothetical protein